MLNFFIHSAVDRAAIGALKRDLIELECMEEKLAALFGVSNDPLLKLGRASPPPVFEKGTVKLIAPPPPAASQLPHPTAHDPPEVSVGVKRGFTFIRII